MKEEEFNKLLMKALDMPEIIEKIKKLFWCSTASSIPQSDGEQYTQLLSAKNGEMPKFKEQLDSLKMQLSAKDDEISNLKLQNKNLQKENDKLQKENDKLSVQLAEAIERPQKMKNEIEGLSARLKPFERISKVLDVYARIPSKTKDSLKNLLGKGSPEELISCSLNKLIEKKKKTTILLETMAGKGTEIGRTFEELEMIIEKVELDEKIGVCLDTCHVYDAGYDVDYEWCQRYDCVVWRKEY